MIGGSRLGSLNLRRLLQHTVVRNTILLYVVQFSGYALPLISLPYLSRVLSTEKFGLIAFAQTFIWYFLAFTEYGFNLTATRSIAVMRDQPEELTRIFSAVMMAKFLLTVVGFGLFCVTVLAVPSLRPNWVLYLIAFVTVIANLLFPLWLFQGLQTMQHVAIRDVAAKLLSLVLLFVFVHGDGDYLIAAAAQSGGLLLAGIAGLVTALQKSGVRFQRPRKDDVWYHLKLGWPAFLSLAMSTFAGITNVFVLGLRAPVTEVAYFTASWRIIAALRGLVSPISTAVYPHASQKAVNSERDVITFVKKYRMLLSAPFLAGGAVLTIGAPWLVPLLLGEKYRPATVVLQIMAFIPGLLMLTQIHSTYYMLACGYDKEWMRIILTSVAINFCVLAPALIFLRGSVALAVTALIVEGVGSFLYWRFFHSHSSEPDVLAETV